MKRAAQGLVAGGLVTVLVAAAFSDAHPTDRVQATPASPVPLAPGAGMRAFPTRDSIDGSYWHPNARVHLTIDDPATLVSPDYEQDATAGVPQGDAGPTNLWFFFSGSYDLKVGDVVVLSDGTTTLKLVVPKLTVTDIDVDDDTVAGSSDPGTRVHVFVDRIHRFVAADAAGAWLADFGGVLNLAPGAEGGAEVWGEYGSTIVDWAAPPATLVVTSDTALTADHKGNIVIGADRVTLDCAGHRVVGSGGEAGVFVQDRNAVAVRNCTILGFRNGIFINRSSRVRLEANEFSENQHGVFVSSSEHLELRGNAATGNVLHGFNIGTTRDSVLAENRASGNAAGFVFTDSDRNVLNTNLAEHNAGFGFNISFSDDNSLEGNISRLNDSGFNLVSGSGNILKGNLASENRINGFQLIRVYQGELSDNSAIRNGGDGFRFDQSADIRFADNIAEDNGEFELLVEASSDIDFIRNTTVGGRRTTPGDIAAELLTFLGLASAVWLGLFLIGQPPRRRTTWLTALTLWSLAGVFFQDFMRLNQPAVGFLQQLQELFGFWPEANQVIARFLFVGWIDKFAVVLWYHATCLMGPGGLTSRQRYVLILGYLLAGSAAVIQIIRPDWWVTVPQALGAAATPAGLLPSFFAASLVVFTGLSLLNLVLSARAVRAEILRRQFALLIAATVLGALIAPLFLLAAGLGLPVERWIGMAMFWLAVVLLGYGVARYSAVVEGRTIQRQFSYSLVAVALITLLYFVVSYMSSVSFGVRTAAFAFVILLAVVTHSLVGNARAILDFFFFDPDTRRVRHVFQNLTNEVGAAGRLHERLGLALDALCTQVRASFGFVLLFSDRRVETVAVFRWSRSTEWALRPENLAADDVVALVPETFPPPLEAAALLSPFYLDTEQIGALLLGQPVNGTRYPPDEIDFIGYASDRMVRLIRADRRRQKALTEMTRLPEPGPTLIASDDEPPIEAVEGALRHMHDFAYLGSCPLARLPAVERHFPAGAGTHVDRGRALHNVLVEAIEKLKPEGLKPTLTSPREWHHYLILHEAYIADRPNRDVMAELYISEGTFNRRRREAIEAVTRILREREDGAATDG